MPRKTTPLYLVYGGSAIDGPVFRAVRRCPPTAKDFLPYLLENRVYAPRKHFQATGVSVCRDREVLKRRQQRFRLPRGIATLDVSRDDIYWTEGGDGHITIWAPASVLLELVVQCDDNG